jgi:hypothetical protein
VFSSTNAWLTTATALSSADAHRRVKYSCRSYQPEGPSLLVRCCRRESDADGKEPGGGATKMTIEIMDVEEITATRIHLDPDAGGA